jgi:hypothetical protein
VVGVSSNDFIDDVARARGLLVSRQGAHEARLQPAGEPPAWFCDLSEGVPDGENDPASFVRWVSPALRTVDAAGSPTFEVRRPGPHSDLGRIAAWFGRRAGRPSPTAEGRYAYTDPHGVVDAELRQRLEHWPDAAHGDGIVRPAELWSIRATREGLIVTSVSWWGSAPALDHQIALALDVAARFVALGGRTGS